MISPPHQLTNTSSSIKLYRPSDTVGVLGFDKFFNLHIKLEIAGCSEARTFDILNLNFIR